MGDPRRFRGTYTRPLKRWDKTRIELERKLMREYALKNKSEIWKAATRVTYLTNRVKLLAQDKSPDAETKKNTFLNYIKRMGFLPEQATLDQVLGLQVKDILERRLQTIVFRKKMANTAAQARQFILHHHITIDGNIANIPSYLVPVAEEGKVAYRIQSTLSSPEHAERNVKKKEKAPRPEMQRRGPTQRR